MVRAESGVVLVEPGELLVEPGALSVEAHTMVLDPAHHSSPCGDPLHPAYG